MYGRTALKALRLFITIHCSYYESNLSPYDPSKIRVA
eukprot:COSAG02_NODE_38253_length_431_cov_0.858434_1_plen_36_part_01